VASILRTCLLLPLIPALACDPAVTIRQVVRSRPNANVERLAVLVEAKRQLVGETHYAPAIRITNLSASPLLVTHVELVAHKLLIQSRFPSAEHPEPQIATQETRILSLWFDLPEDAQKMFRDPVDVRIHYRIGSAEETVQVTVQAGRLQPEARWPKYPTESSGETG
jgi:hypothetical protein